MSKVVSIPKDIRKRIKDCKGSVRYTITLPNGKPMTMYVLRSELPNNPPQLITLKITYPIH